MAERLGHISGDNERASNMPCPECGALPAEQISKTLSDEELRRVAQCVLDILRAEESSRKATDRPTAVEQVPGSDDGSDGAMGGALKEPTKEKVSRSRPRQLVRVVSASDTRAAWGAFNEVKHIYEPPRRDPVAGFAFLPDTLHPIRVMPSITPGNKG